MNEIAIFWFRRDLRIEDNHGLYQALMGGFPVLGIFIFDTNILDKLDDRVDARVELIHDNLKELKAKFEAFGSSLLVKKGRPMDVFKELSQEMTIRSVYTNHDYEPYALERDKKIEDYLSTKNIEFLTFKDQVIFERNEVTKRDGKPYTVFTPYARSWKLAWEQQPCVQYPSQKNLQNLSKTKPLVLPGLDYLGFKASNISTPPRIIRQNIIRDYHINRDFPGIPGTSRLGVHLRFGTLSIRKLALLAARLNQTFLHELIWREFYMMILFHFPHVVERSFKPAYDRIPWRNNPTEFERWCEGTTGYPIVDAGMRELNETGFMHNRVRMISASFLTKHLLIDWRWGEAYFGQRLLDYELSSNNGGWQWAAGSGCDAAPYFRVFNPYLQTAKFDPKGEYIRRWVPEAKGSSYPQPIVEHKIARERALAVYQRALRPS